MVTTTILIDDFDDIKEYSGTNPLLLSKWSDRLDKYRYISKVHHVVKHFVEHNLKIHNENPIKAVLTTESLRSCDKYIMYAANEIELDDKLKVEYTSSWLCEQRVMLMENNILKFNFPTLPRLLMGILFKVLQSNSNINSIRCRSESVNGFMFEAEFFEGCKHGLIVSSCSVDSNKTATLSFTISACRLFSNNEKK